MKTRYIRISSGTQSAQRQIERQHPDERVFIDVISGSVPFNERPAAKELLFAITMNQVESVSVSSIDRLGRNAFNVQETIEHFNKRNINLTVDNLGISSIIDGKPNSIFKMICDVLSNVAQMEKDAIKERQAEGLKIYKAKNAANRELGIVQKRNKATATDEEIIFKYKAVVKELKNGKNSLRDVAKLCDVSLGTVQKVKAAMESLTNKV